MNPPSAPSAQANSPSAADSLAVDTFDLASFRQSQDFGVGTLTKKLLTKIPVRKPAKEWFVRTHPNPEFRLPTRVIELKEDREIYLVGRNLWGELEGESTFQSKLLLPAISKQGVMFVWPIALPRADGRNSDWHLTAHEAADRARSNWVRVIPNMSLGAYEIVEAQAAFSDPDWPDLNFAQIVEIAFRGAIIDKADHPVLQRLRGLA